MPGLDSGIHTEVPLHKFGTQSQRIGSMDCRIKFGNDDVKNRS
jgi:hypothetical protein